MEDKLDAIAKAITELSAKVDRGFADCATKTQMEAVYELLDQNISDHEKEEQERLAIDSHLKRHDKSISDHDSAIRKLTRRV